MEKMTQIYYDRTSDVLYLSVGNPHLAVSEEVGDDILLRLDPETEEVVGLTILNLASRFGSLDTPQILPIEIEVHKSAT